MKILKYTVASLAFMLVASSCQHKFDMYNSNPNEMGLGDITPSGMMEELLFSTFDGMMYRSWQLNGELMQYTVSGTTTNAYHRYIISNGIMGGAWDHLARWAANADHMIKLSVNQEDVNHEAIGLTIRAYLMSNLTDIWGDVPFSEAFKIYDGILQPKFDTQKDVYIQLLADLEKANSLYSTASDKAMTVPDKDLLYKGDIMKWKKFTNSLHLRLLMRLSNRDREMGITAKIRTIVLDPVTYPIFTSNDDSALMRFTGISPFENRFGKDTEDSFNGRRMAEYIINLLNNNGDPRISMYAKQTGSEWSGVPSGMPTQDTEQAGSAVLNKSVIGDYKSPYAIMKYDEILFILSEAAKRGMIDGGETMAEQYYIDGIKASIKYWDDVDPSSYVVTDNTLNNFLANIPYDQTLERILTQKYVALFWVGYEAWHDYRRTGYPVLKIGTGTANGGVLPTRFEYSTDTRSTNEKKYREAVSRMERDYRLGADNMRTPIWWGKAALELGKN